MTEARTWAANGDVKLKRLIHVSTTGMQRLRRDYAGIVVVLCTSPVKQAELTSMLTGMNGKRKRSLPVDIVE